MRLLTGIASWQQWIKEEEGRFADVQHPQPRKFPCYAYMVLDSWGQETLKPIYLFQEQVDAMQLELLAAAQRF